MTKLCVVGGKLQGTEAAYLAKKCNFKVALIDRKPKVPASFIADEFYQVDIVRSTAEAKRIIGSSDAVLPASETLETLHCLKKICMEVQVPYMQDNDAFQISSDKSKSHHFLKEIGVDRPRVWPKANYPLIMKPIRGSGSRNVHRIDSEKKLKEALKGTGDKEDFIVEEFIDGPALSLEAFGKRGSPLPLQVTLLEFDSSYGCKRVLAPAELPETVRRRLFEAAERIVEGLSLTGLTDVQAIVDLKDVPRVNEFNARLPSQTPTVVYYSTGLNMVEQIFNLFSKDELPKITSSKVKAVVYQHVKVQGRTLHVKGEHVMAQAVRLEILKGFMGADEAITNVSSLSGADGCVATLITSNRTLEEAKRKMQRVTERLMDELNLTEYLDAAPK